MQICVDIESTGPMTNGGAIVQIGAVAFEFGMQPKEALEILQDDARCLDIGLEDYGGTVSQETAAFWRGEGAEAWALIDLMPKVDIKNALDKLDWFCGQFLGNKAGVWAKPPMQDLTALRHLYARLGRRPPWQHRQESCLRTLTWIATRAPRRKFKVPDLNGKGLVKHYGLHDAVEQTIVAQAAYFALTGGGP